jgi:uncharacterized membrane protein YdbT with pleckstrin-like domain
MYNLLRGVVLKALKVPPEPNDPLGASGSLLVFRASPNYYKYRLWMWCIGWLIGGPILAVLVIAMLIGGTVMLANEPVVGVLLLLGSVLLFGFAIFQLVLSYVTMRLDYEMRWYKVTDRSLRIREGVWHVREMTMTFDNIQNISLTQGPIQRMLKIADLKVQTAGGGGMVEGQAGAEQMQMFSMHVGFFRGVDNAEEILRLMQERLRRARGSGLGDTDDEPESVALPAAAALPGEVLAAARAVLDEARAFRLAAQNAAHS